MLSSTFVSTSTAQRGKVLRRKSAVRKTHGKNKSNTWTRCKKHA